MYGAKMHTRSKRISNRQRMRMADAAVAHGTRVHMILLACLAQSGGTITIEADTLKLVGNNLRELDFTISEGLKPGESIVRMVTMTAGEKPQVEGPATVTGVDWGEEPLPQHTMIEQGAPDAPK